MPVTEGEKDTQRERQRDRDIERDQDPGAAGKSEVKILFMSLSGFGGQVSPLTTQLYGLWRTDSPQASISRMTEEKRNRAFYSINTCFPKNFLVRH